MQLTEKIDSDVVAKWVKEALMQRVVKIVRPNCWKMPPAGAHFLFGVLKLGSRIAIVIVLATRTTEISVERGSYGTQSTSILK